MADPADPKVQVHVLGERDVQISLPLSEAKKLCVYNVGGYCNTTSPSVCNLTKEGCREEQPVIHPKMYLNLKKNNLALANKH